MKLNTTNYDIKGAEEPLLKDAEILKDLLRNIESVEEAAILIESYGAHVVYVDIPHHNAKRLQKFLEETIVCNEYEEHVYA